MTFRAERIIEDTIKQEGFMDITVVPRDGTEPRDEKIITDNWEEAKQNIIDLEHDNEIYF
jgi:hypothetical protein